MKETLRGKLDKVLTAVIVLLAATCIVLSVKIVTGRDASLFGFQIYHILTGSMEPAIPAGSTILVRKADPAALKEGDIISFVSRDGSIYGSTNTHRIIKVQNEDGRLSFVTKGDANSTVDATAVAAEDVKGKMIFQVNLSWLGGLYSFLMTPPGFVIIVILPLLAVIISLARSFKDRLEEITRQEAEERLEREKDEKHKRKTRG